MAEPASERELLSRPTTAYAHFYTDTLLRICAHDRPQAAIQPQHRGTKHTWKRDAERPSGKQKQKRGVITCIEIENKISHSNMLKRAIPFGTPAWGIGCVQSA